MNHVCAKGRQPSSCGYHGYQEESPYLLLHVLAAHGCLEAVVEMGVALDLHGEGSECGLINKWLIVQYTLRSTAPIEERENRVVLPLLALQG